jgi:hypothetical protein
MLLTAAGIGLYCLFASAALTAVGVSLFFERNLLRLSNVSTMSRDA